MGEVTTIGLDLAKSIFQAPGAAGGVVFRKKLRRDQMLGFFSAQPRCLVAMEACSGAHHWARELGALGHEVRLIPPSYVKPFVKPQKNDMADAEAAGMLSRKPRMLVTVALANKIARIVWALMAHGGSYRAPAAAA